MATTTMSATVRMDVDDWAGEAEMQIDDGDGDDWLLGGGSGGRRTGDNDLRFTPDQYEFADNVFAKDLLTLAEASSWTAPAVVTEPVPPPAATEPQPPPPQPSIPLGVDMANIMPFGQPHSGGGLGAPLYIGFGGADTVPIVFAPMPPAVPFLMALPSPPMPPQSQQQPLMPMAQIVQAVPLGDERAVVVPLEPVAAPIASTAMPGAAAQPPPLDVPPAAVAASTIVVADPKKSPLAKKSTITVKAEVWQLYKQQNGRRTATTKSNGKEVKSATATVVDKAKVAADKVKKDEKEAEDEEEEDEDEEQEDEDEEEEDEDEEQEPDDNEMQDETWKGDSAKKYGKRKRKDRKHTSAKRQRMESNAFVRPAPKKKDRNRAACTHAEDVSHLVCQEPTTDYEFNGHRVSVFGNKKVGIFVPAIDVWITLTNNLNARRNLSGRLRWYKSPLEKVQATMRRPDKDGKERAQKRTNFLTEHGVRRCIREHLKKRAVDPDAFKAFYGKIFGVEF